MKYFLKKDNFLSSKKYVWRDGICLGHIFIEVKGNKTCSDIKKNNCKNLYMIAENKLSIKYNAISYPNESCGQHNSIEDAIVAIENKQHNLFANLNTDDIIIIGADNV
tara:strand:- start:30055 stop:30378 length:324 start_codon:yes stop_codon:yes gene_type:complete